MPLFIAVDGYDEELHCAICLDSFKDPVELQPCEHVYCKACAAQLVTCPSCRKNISARGPAHLVIRNLALKVKVLCDQCKWVGHREDAPRHVCGAASPASAAPAKSPLKTPVPPQATAPPAGSATVPPPGQWFHSQSQPPQGY